LKELAHTDLVTGKLPELVLVTVSTKIQDLEDKASRSSSK
jgi:hypothetical protein